MAFWSQMTSAIGLLVSDFTRVACKKIKKKKKPSLFGLNYTEIGLTQDFYFLVCSDESGDLTDTLSASLYSL